MNRMLSVCGVVALLAAGSVAFPGGAPDNVCNHPLLEPTGHKTGLGATGVNNTDVMEYSLKSRPVQGNASLTEVTLSGPVFKGFVVRANTAPGERNFGEFLKGPNGVDFKELLCQKQEYVAVTHKNSTAKSSITLFWHDLNDSEYNFQATVVPERSRYVMNIFEE